MAIVPDVMLGAVEVLKLFTSAGRLGGGQLPGLPAVLPVRDPPRPAGRGGAPGGRRTPRPRDLERAFTEATARGPRGLPLVQPAEPDRHGAHPDELTAALALAESCGVRVVADEIHAPIVPEGARFTPVASLPAGSRAVSLMSASKAFNLAGLKAAMAVPGPGGRRRPRPDAGGGLPRREPCGGDRPRGGLP